MVSPLQEEINFEVPGEKVEAITQPIEIQGVVLCTLQRKS